MRAALQRSAGVLTLLLFCAQQASAEQDEKSIRGRIEIEAHDICLELHVFLTNTTDKEIVIVTGAGGLPRSVTPSFFSDSTHLEPATWRGFPRRDGKPDPLTLRPAEETLYDVYVVPHPPGDEIEGVIQFGAPGERGHEYIVRLRSQRVPAATQGGASAPKE